MRLAHKAVPVGEQQMPAAPRVRLWGGGGQLRVPLQAPVPRHARGYSRACRARVPAHWRATIPMGDRSIQGGELYLNRPARARTTPAQDLAAPSAPTFRAPVRLDYDDGCGAHTMPRGYGDAPVQPRRCSRCCLRSWWGSASATITTNTDGADDVHIAADTAVAQRDSGVPKPRRSQSYAARKRLISQSTFIGYCGSQMPGNDSAREVHPTALPPVTT